MSMAFAAGACPAEGQFRRLQSAINKLRSLNFLFGTRRPTVSKRVGQYSEPLKSFVNKGHLANNSSSSNNNNNLLPSTANDLQGLRFSMWW